MGSCWRPLDEFLITNSVCPCWENSCRLKNLIWHSHQIRCIKWRYANHLRFDSMSLSVVMWPVQWFLFKLIISMESVTTIEPNHKVATWKNHRRTNDVNGEREKWGGRKLIYKDRNSRENFVILLPLISFLMSHHDAIEMIHKRQLFSVGIYNSEDVWWYHINKTMSNAFTDLVYEKPIDPMLNSMQNWWIELFFIPFLLHSFAAKHTHKKQFDTTSVMQTKIECPTNKVNNEWKYFGEIDWNSLDLNVYRMFSQSIFKIALKWKETKKKGKPFELKWHSQVGNIH